MVRGKGEVSYESPFASVVALRDYPKPVHLELGDREIWWERAEHATF